MFTNVSWNGCQVGQNRFFQVTQNSSRIRILKIDPTQKCFSIEREGKPPTKSPQYPILANFKDEFVFIFSKKRSYRYSLAEDKWKEFPIIPNYVNRSACSHGDKIYLLAP